MAQITEAPVVLTGQYFGAPGGITRYLWVQAVYPSGRSVLSNLITISSAGTLNNQNKILLEWRPVPGAIGYDVIQTPTSTIPTVGATASIALAQGITRPSYTLESELTLQSWTYYAGINATSIPAASITGAQIAAATITGSNLAANTVTGVNVATNLIITFSGVGVDASGGAADATVTGVKAGDILKWAWNMTDLTDVTNKFAATADGNGKISQLNTNLSAKTIFFLFLSQQ